MRHLVTLFLISLVALISDVRANQVEVPSPEEFLHRRIKAVRLPVKVEDIGIFGDGGSISIRFIDAAGETVRVCKDSHSRVAMLDSTGQVQRDISPRLIYFGAENYSDLSAQPCSVGSKPEEALIAILQSYVEQHLTAAERDSVEGPWRRGPPALPFKMHTAQWNATVMMGVIGQLTKQRERLEKLGLPIYGE